MFSLGRARFSVSVLVLESDVSEIVLVSTTGTGTSSSSGRSGSSSSSAVASSSGCLFGADVDGTAAVESVELDVILESEAKSLAIRVRHCLRLSFLSIPGLNRSVINEHL